MVKQSLRIFVFVMVLVVPLVAQPAITLDNTGGYETFLTDRQYDKALEVLNEIEKEKLTVKEKKLILHLEAFQEVETAKPETGLLSTTDEDVGPEIASRVRRYYREGQKSILNNQTELAKDILIYILYIYPNHFKATQLLEVALDLSPGTYKVEDIVKKYTSRSNQYFYGGSYNLAEQDLKVLTILEKDNPLVFERLGSTYYMMNEKKKAIDTWTSALFLDPNNKQLEKVIKKTKEMMVAEAKKLSQKKETTAKKVDIKDPQIMGVFKSQSDAFDMMKRLQKDGLDVAIDETDSGKFSVKVSRKQLLEQQRTKNEKK